MLVNGCVGSGCETSATRIAPEERSLLRRVKLAAPAQGTVIVVPSPVAVIENVPAVLDV